MEDKHDSNEVEETTEPKITIQDLGVVLQLLNVAIKNGAFEPSMLETVGKQYRNLESFLKWQAEALRQQQEEASKDEDEKETE